MEIVRAEEVSRGWTPDPTLAPRRQREEGCDFFSTPPDGGPADAVEVKGWSDALFTDDGSNFRHASEVNAEQLERAKRDPRWRLEIVANLRAVRAGTGVPQRLTLTASEVVARAEPWKFRVRLDGLSLERAVAARGGGS